MGQQQLKAGFARLATSKTSSTAPRTASKAASMEDQPVKDLFGTVPLSKRVHNFVEKTDAGMALDIFSALLSILTVITYMVETHYLEDDQIYQSLKRVDLACSMVFAAEWCFWLWLARDKLRYIISIQSLVDLVTVVPIFFSYFISNRVPGFDTFEEMIRILRVVRVFRIFRLGKRLRSEVQTRLLTMLFTLIAIIIVSAGVFYEMETRFGDTHPDLTFEQAIYWSVVTTTTIGYGDIHPTITASQMTLILLLIITFTVLPYQSSALVSALSYTSVYQSASYSQRAHGRHVVIIGHLTVTTMKLLVEELYHEDTGFQDCNLVFLSPEPPNDQMRRLLKTHKQAHRLLYLQGSCMNHRDLGRAQVELSDAVFIMCNKCPEDARQEDLHNTMLCLAVGQYMLMLERAQLRHGRKLIGQQLAYLMRAVLATLHPSQKQSSMPLMCIQLMLPESQQRLAGLLETYAVPVHHPMGAGQAAAGPAAAKAMAAAGQHGTADPESDGGLAAPLAEVLLKQQTGATSIKISKSASLSEEAAAAAAAAALPGCSTGTDASSLFWQQFRQRVTMVCATEIKYSLLGTSTAVPGAITLLSNLVRSVDASSLLDADFEEVPPWVQEYLEGSANELYEVAAFPAHMVGQPVHVVAKYLQEEHHAVLIATSGSCTAEAVSTAAEAGAVAAAAGGTGPQPILLAPLHHVMTPASSAYVIASDLTVVLDIMEGSEEEYKAWQAKQAAAAGQAKPHVQPHTQLCEQQQQGQGVQLAVKQPAQLKALDEPMSPADSGAEQQRADWKASCIVDCPAAPAVPSLGAGSSSNKDMVVGMASSPAGEAAGQDAGESTTASSWRSRKWRSTGDVVSDSGGISSSSRAAAMMSTSAKALLAAIPNTLTAIPGAAGLAGVHDSSGHKRRHRGAIRINKKTSDAPGHNIGDVALAALNSQLPDMRTRLSCASRRGRAIASRQLQQLYHTRPALQEAAGPEAIVREVVHLQGHLLVCGSSTPPSALFCLLAPLRSSSLPAVQPVVVLDTTTPAGPEWQDIARLAEVYFVHGSANSPEGLMRANAEYAAGAVLLLPWCCQAGSAGPSQGQQDTSAAMVDAYLLAAARSLRSLNPCMQVFCELQLYKSLSFLDPLGSLLDWRCGEAAAAAATPAFMSGAVLQTLMVDCLLCQALYNNGTPRIISQLLTQWHSQTSNCLLRSTPPAAAADAPAAGSSSLQSASSSSSSGGSSREQQCGGAMLLQVSIEGCPCETFGELFAWLLEQRGMICCGLYRQAWHEGRAMCYVYTNPDKDTQLHADDRAFVLVPRTSSLKSHLHSASLLPLKVQEQ